MKIFYKVILFVFILFSAVNAIVWEGMSTPQLHVEGRYLKDPHGNVVNLHSFAQTYSPWFNEQKRIQYDWNR